jgi:hypothetical protein
VPSISQQKLEIKKVLLKEVFLPHLYWSSANVSSLSDAVHLFAIQMAKEFRLSVFLA